jgi:peptide deformylase
MTAISQPVGMGVPLGELLGLMRAAQQMCRQPCVAAKHVGVNVRVLLINTSFDRNRMQAAPVSLVLVNPEVTEWRNPLVAGLESDIFIPDYQGSVERHSAIRVRFLDEAFAQQEEVLTGLAARWAIHGAELLDGKLFIDHLNPHRLRSIRGHLKRLTASEGTAR